MLIKNNNMNNNKLYTSKNRLINTINQINNKITNKNMITKITKKKMTIIKKNKKFHINQNNNNNKMITIIISSHKK